MSNEIVVEQVQKWVNDFVIQYNICPFAKKVFVQNRIKYSLCYAQQPEQILQDLLVEIQLLEQIDSSQLDTTLFILPKSLNEFGEYLDFIQVTEGFLEVLGFDGIFQIATFHPDYQFEGTAPSDAENFTNRAPFPIIHILREDSLEKAIENYPNPEEIPNNNIQKMNELGLNTLQKLFDVFQKRAE